MPSGARQLVRSTALVALCSCALAGRARAQTEPPCAGSIDVHAVDATTHAPISGATVRVNGDFAAVTDATGHSMLTGLCPGEVVVEVERADYGVGRKTVTVAGKRSLELELEILPGEVILIEEEAPAPTDMRSTAVLSGDALDRARGQNLADTLADLPGVDQLGSGTGVGKPIVRGHHGRRLLLQVDSVRHRAQDWGTDHAPEIDPFTADQLTVVRGAAGVRYGPDAIGGAILVEPPALLRQPGVAGEAHMIGQSNGRGGSVASRLQAAPARLPGLAWQIEGSLTRLAAPVAPDYPLDNTGASEWNVGATAGYRPGDADYKLSYRRHQAQLGVCSCLRIESIDDFRAQLDRDRPVGAELYTSEFDIERPYQAVAHDTAVARGRWRPSPGVLTGTYAFQLDHRREYDVVRQATTGPQFDFRLFTHDLDVVFEHNPIHLTDHLHLRGSTGVVGMAQIHNYSGLPLVPDHQAWSAGVYAIERLLGHDFELEAGLRYDILTRTASLVRRDFLRMVRSDQLAADACGAGDDADPVECDSTFHTVSASVGGLAQLTPAWSAKLDLSTTSRPPNPDEQYLNGTSPTSPVFGLGKPDLGPETTYSASATTTFEGQRFAAEASAHASFISDYIYFAPALNDEGEPIIDVLVRGAFPRFMTRAVDAVFYGADGGAVVRPVPSLELGGQVSMVRARNTSDDSYLVFVPPDRLRGSATYTLTDTWGLRQAFASVAGTYAARQDRFDPNADLAPPPDAYFLLDAEIGAETRIADQTVKVSLQGSNLLDARYRDYTSLLRYFADRPGRQLMLRLSVQFSSPDQK